MIQDNPTLITAIRNRFAHIDSCPFQGPRVYFENGGGALTLKSVVETSAKYAAFPDNQGRDNPAAKALVKTIEKAKADLAVLMNPTSGQFIVGETGTELLFRMIRTACLNAPKGSKVIGSSIEHPSSRSAARHWAGIGGMDYVNVAHSDANGIVTAQDYAAQMTPDVAVATILHASPVTGIGIDVAAISKVIRAVAPDCMIIVDGIQHAAHGQINLAAYDADGYAISPYKVFSRHGYGIAWISDRLTALPHEALIGGPTNNWELGTRDTGAFAAISDVVAYFDWLGGEVSEEINPRQRIEAAGKAINNYETVLTDTLINGTGNLPGLREMDEVTILAGADNLKREGTVSFVVEGVASTDVVSMLNKGGIRTHVRKADHYSGNILKPLDLPDCIRISMCHYNTTQEVSQVLAVMNEIDS
ncbi:aminotransferase class V-fold PLP-dependent enzyme [Aliiroseovarius sp. S1339]|uniref:aminotransferase class V-fold PLP-dependent enzyme n=1 Tax=Aliiroseovarius sp. S1339 TaxID=2936990 RepID=UPI0020BFBC70|nr:aminotransferase class V-fold PLP-dependent enzyme [Aliiroseovarius sp. S1339]MCK8463172.1 aminotransferase class V-fold PLP-dependent enzyme [Aliiroseovarius sp. S1339]